MNNDDNNENSLSHRRKERIFFLYRNYLLDDSKEEIESDQFNFNKKQIDFINLILKDIDSLENKIKKFIPSDWIWERFNFLEKAILLNAASEMILKKKDKKIIINESVEFAKKYCSEKAPPLINGILDKIEN